jgi:hypothetical protein
LKTLNCPSSEYAECPTCNWSWVSNQ